MSGPVDKISATLVPFLHELHEVHWLHAPVQIWYVQYGSTTAGSSSGMHADTLNAAVEHHAHNACSI